MPRPVLDISNLRLRRGGTVILDGISWRVERGQHWAVLGANGSGKTSLLSALTGYFMPTAGEIVVLGRRYGRSDWRELRKRIGLVSSSIRQLMADDEPALASIVSGKSATIDFRGRASARDLAAARRILRDIECAHLAERPWLFLSQGERQRVLIGRALMARPRLLILDEPCAGLDPAAREHFLQFLQRLGGRAGAPTLLLVTHHVEEITPVFSHVLVLKAGRVLAAGKKSEVLNSRVLSAAFSARLRLDRIRNRYSLKVLPRKRRMM
jgi:iron complex transport system ATP-binding protein